MSVPNLLRLLTALLLGAGAAVLVSCGSSGAGLIPSESAGPLESDFQAIASAARTGNGNCSPTEIAIHNAESNFHALPRSIDAGLRLRLSEGITHLSERALVLCAQPLSQTTTGEASTPTKTAPSTTTKTQTQTTSTGTTQTTPTTSTTETGPVPSTPEPSGPGGGTPAPGVGGSSEGQGGEGGGSGEGAGNGGAGNGDAGNGGAGVGGGGEQ